MTYEEKVEWYKNWLVKKTCGVRYNEDNNATQTLADMGFGQLAFENATKSLSKEDTEKMIDHHIRSEKVVDKFNEDLGMLEAYMTDNFDIENLTKEYQSFLDEWLSQNGDEVEKRIKDLNDGMFTA